MDKRLCSLDAALRELTILSHATVPGCTDEAQAENDLEKVCGSADLSAGVSAGA